MITFDIDKITSLVLNNVCKDRETLQYLYPVSEYSWTTSIHHTN